MTKSSTQIQTSAEFSKQKDSGAFRHLWLSPWTSWIGFRYLKSKKNSRFLSFITLLSIFGVGLGVTAMIVVLSVMDGFESELKKRMMSSDLHILIQPTPQVPGFDGGYVPSSVLNPSQVKKLVDQSHSQIEHFWPVVSTEVILRAGRKVMGIALKGVSNEQLETLKKQVVESAENHLLAKRQGADSIKLPGILIGQELAYELGVIPGDEVTLVSPTETEGPLSGIPRLRKYVVEGVYHIGMPETELHTAYATSSAVWSFLKRPNVVSQWEVTVKNFDRAPAIAAKIRQEMPLLRVQDWMQLNSNLFASLRLERISMFIILTFIVIVASFNIVTTLTLMVLEKKKEISILKAMGARHGQVAAIFLAEGLLIGVVGVGGGALLGLFFVCGTQAV